MKLLTLLLLIPVFTFAQSKGDTKIIVTPADTTGLFGRVALALVERGYVIDRKDPDLGYIATMPRKLDKWEPEVKVNVLIKGGQLIFTGFGDTRGKLSGEGLASSGTFDPITFTGKGNYMRSCWDELENIARLFGSPTFSR